MPSHQNSCSLENVTFEEEYFPQFENNFFFRDCDEEKLVENVNHSHFLNVVGRAK